LIGIAVIPLLILLQQNWKEYVGDVYLELPGWLIVAQLVLLSAAGILALLLIRKQKLSFWAPAAGAVIGFIGIPTTLFIAIASLPCPSSC
jgi:hypothetical protein